MSASGEGRDVVRDSYVGRRRSRRSGAAELLASPGFGQVFTDHMVTIEWDEGTRLARRAAAAIRPVQHGSG